jgi:transposase
MGWVSGQAYSHDLRARVLAAVDRGGRVYEVAALFEVSVSYIYKALARRRHLGIDTALPKVGRPGRIATSMRWLRALPPIPTRHLSNSSTGRTANVA